MQEISIQPVKKLKGIIKMPGDKSISHRAIILGSISEGEIEVKGFLNSEDCFSTINIFREMGIQIEKGPQGDLLIKGKGLHGLSKPESSLDAGNSGTTMRLVCGLLAGQNFESTITGDKSLSKRPMKRIICPLEEMGAKIDARDGNFAPLVIRGGSLKGINYVSKIASAQVKSCLLLAGLYAKGKTTIREPVKSRDHTERMLEHLGVDIRVDDLTVSLRQATKLKGKSISVPGDISSATFFIIGALLLKGSELLIKDVGLNPARTGVLKVLSSMGAEIIIENERLQCSEPVGDIIIKSNDLKGVKITGDLIPSLIDELPALAVAATQAEGVTEISGAGELRVKETDRIKAISSQLGLLGARIQEKDDGMIIHGKTKLEGTEVNSFSDHRMAMSLAIAGLIADGTTKIKDTECINTSFPQFIQILEKITG